MAYLMCGIFVFISRFSPGILSISLHVGYSQSIILLSINWSRGWLDNALIIKGKWTPWIHDLILQIWLPGQSDWGAVLLQWFGNYQAIKWTPLSNIDLLPMLSTSDRRHIVPVIPQVPWWLNFRKACNKMTHSGSVNHKTLDTITGHIIYDPAQHNIQGSPGIP